MQELQSMIRRMFDDAVYHCIVSEPVPVYAEYEKIIIRRLGNGYQAEKFRNNQVFHESISQQAAAAYVAALFETSFRQLNAWSEKQEYNLRISKKGKLLATRRAISSPAPKKEQEHNREKQSLLQPGAVIEPLVDMGIMTPEGKVINTMYNKYRQINRFLEIIDDEVGKISTDHPLSVVDLCCGKSYLSFVLYHYLTRIKGLSVQMLGLDLKESVIRKCADTARKYGYDGMSFDVQDINAYRYDGHPDLVIALHACDIATDYVLYNAVRWQARSIFSVPCCQHELNGQIESNSILTRYGIVQERVAALMTDAIRANLLACCGYQAQLLEFVDIEHTPKNILIRAVRTGRTDNRQALAEVEAIMREYHLTPALFTLLHHAGFLG